MISLESLTRVLLLSTQFVVSNSQAFNENRLYQWSFPNLAKRGIQLRGPRNADDDRGETEMTLNPDGGDTDDDESESDAAPKVWEWQVSTGNEIDVTEGATVFTDLTQDLNENDPSLKENLLDGDPFTVFAMYRVEDYEFEVRLLEPAVVTRIEILQPWDDWAKPTAMRISNAAGETVDIERLILSRESEQSLILNFSKPTDFLSIKITEASPSSLEWDRRGTFGGLSELIIYGHPVLQSGDGTGPSISKIVVEKMDEGQQIKVQWETDVPATSQLNFRDRRGVHWEHGDGKLRTRHSVVVDASSSPVSGLLRLRSVNGHGSSTERWDATLANGGKLEGRDFMFGVGADHPEASTSHGSPSIIREMGMRNDFVKSWISRQNEWRDWLPSFLADAKRAGYQAQILHWFYGDNPQKAEVLRTREEYRQSIRDMDLMIIESGLGSNAVVTLEPEYNSPTGDLADWEGWNDIIIDAINIIKSGSGAQVCVYAGWWDSENLVPISLGRAAMFADCASTMKMAASVDTTEPEYSRREHKARTAVTDAIRFSHFMQRNFMIPVRWDYFLVSEYGGWEQIQKEVMTDLCNRIPEIQENGVISIAWMSYQDSRDQHNLIYGEAEYHKGLLDMNGNKKPNAWDIWNTCGGI